MQLPEELAEHGSFETAPEQVGGCRVSRSAERVEGDAQLA